MQKPLKRNFTFSDKANGIFIFETEKGGKSLRCLTFSEGELGLRQGCIYKKYPENLVLSYTKLIIEGVKKAPNKNKILMLGMGIGTIPKKLSTMYPNSQIDIVEILPTMPQIAKQFFYFEETANMKIFIEDAYTFVEKNKDYYDIIIMDIFDKTYIPSQFLTHNFIISIKNRLKPNGTFIVNTFSSSPYYEEEGALFRENFPINYELKAENRILVLTTEFLPLG